MSASNAPNVDLATAVLDDDCLKDFTTMHFDNDYNRFIAENPPVPYSEVPKSEQPKPDIEELDKKKKKDKKQKKEKKEKKEKTKPEDDKPPKTREPQYLYCSDCGTEVVTKVQLKNGSAVWVSMASIFLLGGVLGSFLIPLGIDSLKDVAHKCPKCDKILEYSKKL